MKAAAEGVPDDSKPRYGDCADTRLGEFALGARVPAPENGSPGGTRFKADSGLPEGAGRGPIPVTNYHLKQ
jgi:hypothetical protein